MSIAENYLKELKINGKSKNTLLTNGKILKQAQEFKGLSSGKRMIVPYSIPKYAITSHG